MIPLPWGERESDACFDFLGADILGFCKHFFVFLYLPLGQTAKSAVCVLTDNVHRSGNNIAIQTTVAFHAVRFGFFIANDDCAVIKGGNDLHQCVFAAPADRTLPMAQIIEDSCFNWRLAGKDHQSTQTVHALTLGGVKVFALHPAERITEVTAVFDQRDVLSFEDVRCERSATVDAVIDLTVIGFFCGNPVFLSDLTV